VHNSQENLNFTHLLNLCKAIVLKIIVLLISTLCLVENIITVSNIFRYYSLEQAFWYTGNSHLSLEHFVMAVVAEFRFEARDQVDVLLRRLYLAFEGTIGLFKRRRQTFGH
jgi:hypothetical protein